MSLPNIHHVFVTGAAGFLGSNLVDQLLQEGIRVTAWDNFSSGQIEFLEQASKHRNFTLIRGDTLDQQALTTAMHGCDFVFHLAANADVRRGLEAPQRDLQQNTIATFQVLEAMRGNSIEGIAFASTASVYGEAQVIPTPENAPFPIQTSLYSASKLAGEALIQAYCEGFQFHTYIFRLVSLLGPRYSHGHIFDFCNKLKHDAKQLTVLGNGKQRKSYLHVQDCVQAMLHVIRACPPGEHKPRVNIFNIGTNDSCLLTESIKWITTELQLEPLVSFGTTERGWVGDNPLIQLDISKICATGWRPQYSIAESVSMTVRWLRENEWIFERRK